MTIFRDNGYCRGEILSLYPAESIYKSFSDSFFERKTFGKKSESEGVVFQHIWIVSNMSKNLRPTAAAVEEESASSTEEQTW